MADVALNAAQPLGSAAEGALSLSLSPRLGGAGAAKQCVLWAAHFSAEMSGVAPAAAQKPASAAEGALMADVAPAAAQKPASAAEGALTADVAPAAAQKPASAVEGAPT